MRKPIAIISVLIFALLFSGCSFTPESAVKTYLNDIKTGVEISAFERYIEDDVLAKININDDGTLDAETTDTIELSENIFAKIRDFDYEITGHKDNEDGTVDVFVNITSYDLRTIFTKAFRDALKDAVSDAFSAIFSDEGFSDDEFSDKMLDSLNSSLAIAEKNFKDSVIVKVEKNGLKWEPVNGDSNRELYNAISGGILGDIDSIVNMVNGF